MFCTVPASSKGFTLIEMMVAVTIFSIVLLIGAGSILTIIDANRKAQSLKSVVNNLNFALETMSRNIRVGTTYWCDDLPTDFSAIPSNINVPRDCTEGNTLALESQYGGLTINDQLVYTLKDGAIKRGRGNSPASALVSITAPEVTITDMKFSVDGAENDPLDGVQPRVRMLIRGYAEVGGQRSEFNIQTAVTQRILDL